MFKTRLMILTFSSLSLLLGGCTLLPKMEPRVYKVYDETSTSPQEIAVVKPQGGIFVKEIDEASVQHDVLNGLRNVEFHLTPGLHSFHTSAELDKSTLKHVGTYTTTNYKTIPIYLEKGKTYNLQFEKKSAYQHQTWVEEADSGEFISGWREVVEGSSAKPPYTVKSWQGQCKRNGCTHVYKESRCKAAASCSIITKNCVQGKGCKNASTFNY